MVAIELGLSLGSAATGYALSAWRNRLIPLVGLTGFHYHCSEDDKVGLSPDLVSKISRLIGLPYQCLELQSVHEIHLAHEHAEELSRDLADAIPALKKFKIELSGATSERDVIGAVRRLWRSKVRSIVQVYAINDAVKIAQSTMPERLKYVRASHVNGGCFTLDMRTWVIYVGSDFNEKNFREEKIAPLVSLISRLDAKALLVFADSVLTVAEEQETLAKALVPELEPIVEKHSKWFGGISISNFGKNPFLIFPKDSKLVIQSQSLTKVPLECVLAPINRQGEPKAIAGIPQIIEPNTTRYFSIKTVKMQQEIQAGAHLKQAFKDKSATAFFRLRYRGRDSLWPRTVSSRSVSFSRSGSDD